MSDRDRETIRDAPGITAGVVEQERPGTPVRPTVEAWEVLARFSSTAALEQAIERLHASGFGHADLALPELDPPPELATPEAGSMPAETEVGRQQNRIVPSAVVGAFLGMMAATATAATGGVAAAVAGVGLGVGVAVAGAVHLMTRMLGHSGREQRQRRARSGKLILSVRTATTEKRERAVVIVREAGGDFL